MPNNKDTRKESPRSRFSYDLGAGPAKPNTHNGKKLYDLKTCYAFLRRYKTTPADPQKEQKLLPIFGIDPKTNLECVGDLIHAISRWINLGESSNIEKIREKLDKCSDSDLLFVKSLIARTVPSKLLYIVATREFNKKVQNKKQENPYKEKTELFVMRSRRNKLLNWAGLISSTKYEETGLTLDESVVVLFARHVPKNVLFFVDKQHTELWKRVLVCFGDYDAVYYIKERECITYDEDVKCLVVPHHVAKVLDTEKRFQNSR